jgi:hypothetical protein
VNWLADYWIDILGWGGSALLVSSLLQARVLRFRALNLLAGLILIVFIGLIEVWPMVAMNVVLSAINVWFIVKLLSERHDDTAFEVLEVNPDDAYLRHVLKLHAADIARFQPDFDPSILDGNPGSAAYLVEKGYETVGVVVMETEGETAYVRLDYVTPRYRDFSPGEFVWRRSGLLVDKGLRRVITPRGMVGAYYHGLGFTEVGDSYVLELDG